MTESTAKGTIAIAAHMKAVSAMGLTIKRREKEIARLEEKLAKYELWDVNGEGKTVLHEGEIWWTCPSCGESHNLLKDKDNG